MSILDLRFLIEDSIKIRENKKNERKVWQNLHISKKYYNFATLFE